MADRTSAALFGRIFEHLAQQPDERNQAFAKELHGMTDDYDFSQYQMGCDAALRKLGIAVEGDDQE